MRPQLNSGEVEHCRAREIEVNVRYRVPLLELVAGSQAPALVGQAQVLFEVFLSTIVKVVP